MSNEPYSPLHRPESGFERKLRRSPLSLFFPSFNRQSSESSTSFNTPSRNPSSSKRREIFRNSKSFDTATEKKSHKKGYRTLLTPEDCNKDLVSSLDSQYKKKKKKPPKSVSFQDLIVYPTILTQAIRSISPGRTSKFSTSSDHSHYCVSVVKKENRGVKKSISNYILGCKSRCCGLLHDSFKIPTRKLSLPIILSIIKFV